MYHDHRLKRQQEKTGMTFSILARDPQSGAIGAAAATGSLCVGGWVLRGELSAGLSASQGAAPSTFWGDDVLRMMGDGMCAEAAVEAVSTPDLGRQHRQLSALDLNGGSGVFTGAENQDAKGGLAIDNAIVAGNMLRDESVLPAMADAFATSTLPFDQRLLAALSAANHAGGDFRGLLSAALLMLHPDKPPLTLRIDYHDTDPIGALRKLHQRASSGDYADWLRQVPVASDRQRYCV